MISPKSVQLRLFLPKMQQFVVCEVRHIGCKFVFRRWKWKVKVTWQTAKYGDPYSEFVLCIYPIQSAHTQQWTHTHLEHTPGAVGSHLCCGARGAVGGSVSCSRVSHLSRGIEGGESAGHSLPPPTIPASTRLELATFRLRVRLSNH